jgi:hypothetical protein
VAILFIIVSLRNDFLDVDGKVWGLEEPGFFGLIANITTAGGFVAIAFQIYLQRKDQKAQGMAQLYEELGAPEFQKKLALIYDRGRTKEKLKRSELTKEFGADCEKVQWIEDVTRGYNTLAYRIRIGVNPKQESIALGWEAVIRIAQRLVPHIKEQRKNREEHSRLQEIEKYRGYFVWYAKECKLHHLWIIGCPKTDEWGDNVSLDDLETLLAEHPLGYADPPPVL